MALGQVQQQRQSQTLSLTPELQQSLKMLQMSTQDLAAVVATELENNPLLSEPIDNYADVEKTADSSQMDSTELGKTDGAEVLDYDYSQSWDDLPTSGRSDFMGNDSDFDQTIAKEKDFREELLEQFSINVQDNKQRIIALQMVDLLDDAGYFIGNLAEIADNLGCDTDEVELVLLEMQKLEPTGIFARDLCECLSLQLKEHDRLDPCMYTLVSNLPLLGANKLDELMRLCEVDFDELMEMVKEIKSLNPKPAAHLTLTEFTPSAPDVLITKTDDGDFAVQVNNAALPKVLADKKYYTKVVAGTRDKEEKKFLTQKWQSANFIVRALEQRAETMLKTAAAIVKHQNEFFRFGIKYLKPLTLAQIAEEIDMHESTVSRVTSNKYLQTPRGNFEMKYFFTSGVSNSGGEVASTSVKEMIREMIVAEDHKKPLSDEALAKMLAKKGVKISRRTVMKYREALDIASSYERKNQLVVA
jgi:RNA polymerase sigma-54 factor